MRNLIVSLVGCAGVAAAIGLASCSSTSSPCPPCGTGLVCDPVKAQCVAQSEVGSSCGLNALAGAGGCACQTGYSDCNSDIGQPGGNGCECSGACAGTSCSGGTTTRPPQTGCSPFARNDCGTNTRFCETDGSCQDCPLGAFNCDGKHSCESPAPCDGGSNACVVNYPHSCGDQAKFCEDTTDQCTACAPGTFNCDGTGKCECNTTCNGNTCSDVSQMSCTDLEIAYGEAITEARVCDDTVTPDQCSLRVEGGLACGCTIFVNPANTTALHKLQQLKQAADAKACSYSCPPIAKCADPQQGKCKSGSKSGKCLY